MKRRALFALLCVGLVLAAFPTAPASAASRADLVVGTVSIEEPSVPAGGTIAVHEETSNIGGKRAGASKTAFYLSSDAAFDRRDVKLKGMRSVARLAAGSRSAGITQVRVPKTLVEGHYRVIGCADALREVGESVERNNCTASDTLVPFSALPPSESLIERGVARSEITEEAGWIYRLYAAFGGGDVPSRYRGAAGALDSHLLSDVHARWDDLSPALQEKLAPHFVMPMYAESWASRGADDAKRKRTGAERARSSGETICEVHGHDAKWGFFDGVDVRVWYRKTTKNTADEAQAQKLANEVTTTIGPKLLGVLGALKSDGGSSSGRCRGGDDRIDVSLVPKLPGAGGMAVPFRGETCGAVGASTFVLLKSGQADDEAKAALAHELLHVTQFAYSQAACMDASATDWLSESTATWFMDHVYGTGGAQYEHGFARQFLGRPSMSLLAETDGQAYGAYLFWFYLTHNGDDRWGPEVVRGTYDRLPGASAAIDALVSTLATQQQTLAKIWPRFAIKNWNRPPETAYQTWDGLAARAFEVEVDGFLPSSVNEQKYPVDGVLPPLSSRYYHYNFREDVRRIDVKSPGSNVVLRAIKKIAGVWTVDPDPWTDDKRFCRDQTGEDLQELVLIFSNVAHSGSPIDLTTPESGVTVRPVCVEAFEGTLYASIDHDSSWGDASSYSAGDRHRDETIVANIKVAYDQVGRPYNPWRDAGSSVAVQGTLDGFSRFGSCRWDYDQVWNFATAPSDVAFYPGSEGMNTAVADPLFTGSGIENISASGECSGTETFTYTIVGSAPCRQGVLSYDADGKATITFIYDHTDTHTGDRPGTTRYRCNGTLTGIDRP